MPERLALLACALLLSSRPALQDDRPPEPDLGSIVAEIDALRDRTPVATFDALGELRTKEAFDALRAVFEDERIEHIYLLSDGEPAGGTIDEPEKILKAVAEWNRGRGVRIHCISAGYRNPFLVDLAALTGGPVREAD